MKRVTVSVPATTANLGPGFDCVGMALGLYNEVTLSAADTGLHVDIVGEAADVLPRNAQNLAVCAAERVFAQVGQRPAGLVFQQQNGIPIKSGLGSSAAAIVAGLVAANELLGVPLTAAELLTIATDMEGHPDNVAPALYGGLMLIAQNGGQMHIETIETPVTQAIIVLPQYSLSTEDARRVLPSHVPMADVIYNISHAALLIRAFAAGDYDLLGLAMQDRVHQPYRLPLVPGWRDVFDVARGAGAAAVAVSGAGPSVVAFAPDNHMAVASAMQATFTEAGLDSRAWVLPINTQGANVQVVTDE